MRRAVVGFGVALLLALGAAGLSGCPTKASKPGAGAREPSSLVSPGDEAAREAERARMERLRKQREALESGWKVGFTRQWRAAVEEARDKGPSAFRKEVLGAWWMFGLTALALGFGLRALASSAALQARDRRGLEATMGAFARPLLRVLVGPTRETGEAWPRALRASRDAERHLRLAGEAAQTLGKGDPRGGRLGERLSAWRDELATLRRGLEERGPHVPWVRDAANLAALEQAAAAAATVKVGMVRAVASEAAATQDEWLEWERQLNVRPKTPTLRASATTTAEATDWVRPTGWIGVGLTGASVLLVAGWVAAGAVPTAVAAVAAVLGLMAVSVARTHLRVHDSPPLLPGAADALLMRLVGVVGISVGVLLASATTDAQSGLNLGAPPPLTIPEKIPVDALPVSLTVAPTPTPTGPAGGPGAK